MSCLFSCNWLKMGNSWYTEHISYGIVLLNWCSDEPLAGFYWSGYILLHCLLAAGNPISLCWSTQKDGTSFAF